MCGSHEFNICNSLVLKLPGIWATYLFDSLDIISSDYRLCDCFEMPYSVNLSQYTCLVFQMVSEIFFQLGLGHSSTGRSFQLFFGDIISIKAENLIMFIYY